MKFLTVRMFLEASPEDHELGSLGEGLSSGSMGQVIGQVSVHSEKSPHARLATLEAYDTPQGVELGELLVSEELTGLGLEVPMVELLAAGLFQRGPVYVHWAEVDGRAVEDLGFTPLPGDRWRLDPDNHARLVSRVLLWRPAGLCMRRSDRRLRVSVSARILDDPESRAWLESFAEVPDDHQQNRSPYEE